MAEINSVVLVGRLTRDGELKYSGGGMAILKFSLAINKRVKKGDQWVDQANFFDCTMLGKGAESVSKYVVKGKQIGVVGELTQNTWEKDGQRHSKVEIFVNTLQLLGGNNAIESNTVGSSQEEYSDDIPF